MNILSTAAVNNKSITWALILLILLGGSYSFSKLSRLEDPTFTVKMALVVTAYPGASPQEVEEEVTLPLENVIQQLPYIKHITSTSSAGLSQIKVEMKTIYGADDLPQIWDEMRRKIRDVQPLLPPGVLAPQIQDDIGDIFGVYLALTGESYGYDELEDYADFLHRELTSISGVGRVVVVGRQQEQIFIEIDRAKMVASGITPEYIDSVLSRQNTVHPAGNIRVADQYLRISPTRQKANNLNELSDLLLGGKNGNLVYLKDVATITKGFASPPAALFRHNGNAAINLGVAFLSEVNVVGVGEVIEKKLKALEYSLPVGMTLSTIYNQSQEVKGQISNFERSFLMALAIVTLVIFLAMGWRLGIVISSTLLLTVLLTFAAMALFKIELHRISLGALIIALGMLVDNSIVVAEGVIGGIKQGWGLKEAAQKTIARTRLPLLMATLIAILAFAPIGLSPDMTGEWMVDLFWVIFIALVFSWIVAIGLTPFFCDILMKDSTVLQGDGRSSATFFYHGYRRFLGINLDYRKLSAVLLIVILGVSFFGFGQVKQSFFPFSGTSTFMIRFSMPQGSDINALAENVKRLEKKILSFDSVSSVTSSVGQGHPRFTLVYEPILNNPSDAELIVRNHSVSEIPQLIEGLKQMVQEEFPHANSQFVRLQVGPTLTYKIEARIIGPDPDVLRKQADRIIQILDTNPEVAEIDQDWSTRSLVIRPKYNDAKGARLGVGLQDLERAIAWNLNGQQVGLYRDGSSLLPILIRAPESERNSIESIHNIQVFSPVLQTYVNIDQVIDEVDLTWEDSLIKRRDRKRSLSVLFNPVDSITGADLHKKIRHEIEAVQLPTGYRLEWGAEFGGQQTANTQLMEYVPLGALVMVLLTVLILGSLKQSLLVWLTVPFSVCGITIGLLVTDSPFSFTAFLALISLVGMQLRNGIILLEEIVHMYQQDGVWKEAIFHGAVNRFRPVMLAAITTILGMVPLLEDVFFQPMAVSFMFGLGFSTLITLIALPVMMSITYDRKKSKTDRSGTASDAALQE